MLSGTGLSGDAGITVGTGDTSGLPDSVKAAIGDRPVIQLTLTLDGKQTAWNNPEAPVTVSIPLYADGGRTCQSREHRHLVHRRQRQRGLGA